MLAIERRNEILARLLADGKVIVSDLSQQYRVTEETIRRDLERLEQEGFAHKTYGGAVRSESYNVDVPYQVRKQANVSEKQYIAQHIGEIIQDGDYIMLDSSTTALAVAKHILHLKKITLITNSIEILLEVRNKSDWRVFSTGGMLKESGLSLVGAPAERMVSCYHVDIAVCSCKGIDQARGITDSTEQDAEIKKAFYKAAKKRVLAADASKFDRVSFVRIAEIGEMDAVFTNEEPNESWKQAFAAAQVELVY